MATMFSGVGIQPGTELSTKANDGSLKYGVQYFRLLDPISTTFCSKDSDCRQSLLSVVLTRKFSGLEHALKFEKMQASRLLSNSQQVSLDNQGKVIGRELFEQKVVQVSRPLAVRVDGKAILYESMTSSLVEPMEQLSIASTSGDHVSCRPFLSLS
jgi:hypothetical protein